MTHSLGFDSLSEKLFLLRQLATASREYCKQERIGRKAGRYADDAWHDYALKLRQLVSNYSIECAIKTRMLQDALAGHEKIDFAEIEADAISESSLGTVHDGNFELTVRESCNKIIHATSVELGWVTLRLRNPSQLIEYWNGHLHLRGKYGKSFWHVELDMVEWTSVVDYFIDLATSKASNEYDLE